jgi:hypothetical protein
MKPCCKKEVQKVFDKIDKIIANHKKEADGDGFPVCPIEEEKSYCYDRKAWRGTDERFEEAKKEHEDRLKTVSCDICDLEKLKAQFLKEAKT